jgi:hypothetical protein
VTKPRARASTKKTPAKAVDSDNENAQNGDGAGDEGTATTPASGATVKPTPKKRTRKPKNAAAAAPEVTLVPVNAVAVENPAQAGFQAINTPGSSSMEEIDSIVVVPEQNMLDNGEV